MWQATELDDAIQQHHLRTRIVETIDRLKRQINGKVRLSEIVRQSSNEKQKQPTLFTDDKELPGREQAKKSLTRVTDTAAPRFPEPTLRVYAKDFADHALQHLPQAVKYHSVEDFRKYLSQKLRFNSQATRRRSGNYIISRFFPGEVYNDDLPAFAAFAAGTPALGEALFYLTCRAEKIVSLVAEEVVFPSLAQGGVSRTKLRDFIQTKFPGSKSVKHVAQAIVRTYEFYGLGTANRTRLSVSLREGNLASFAYVLHLEFPEPGMYSFERMFDGPMHKWLLWDKEWMIRQLYQLREAGVLSKVSEIDRMRQFTTKYPLIEAVRRIVTLGKESPA